MDKNLNLAEFQDDYKSVNNPYSQLRVIVDYVKMTYSITKDESNFLDSVKRSVRNIHRLRNDVAHYGNLLFDEGTDALSYLNKEIKIICDSLYDLIIARKEKDVIIQYLRYIPDLASQIELSSYRDKHIVYNSEGYYKDLIDSTEKAKREAEEEVEKYKNALAEEKQIGDQNAQQLAMSQLDLDVSETKLKEANTLLEKYKTDLEEKKKQDNAIEQWDQKIANVFNKLEECINPIKDEHRKLNNLFYIYGFLSGLIVILLIVIEIIIYTKVCTLDTLPTFDNYFALVLPIPIAVGLLCGFITQVNRAQLQMVVLSRHIHEVKYTEGLLLAINGLTTNIKDSTMRINDAIDKLLEKHLADNSHNMGWDTCVKSEEQSLSSNELIKILKEIKGLVAK